MVARVAAWAARKVGGRSPVPSEPLRARRSSAGLAELLILFLIVESLVEMNFNHGGELVTKVGYFGVKSAKVPPGADGYLIC